MSRICHICGYIGRPLARYCSACGVQLITSSNPVWQGPLRRGELLGDRQRYRIERALGRGGFGEAYLASDTLLDRPCVIKRLVVDAGRRPEQQQRLRANFQREARLLASLNVPGHPNIPEIYELLLESDCLVLKFIDGQNLDQLLDRRLDPLPETEALRYTRDICSALVYMHSRPGEPVLHRDIKPSNILLDATGRIWLIDFGLAKAKPAAPVFDDPRSSCAAGTLGYTPPEQWQSASEPRSDVFALGATLHTLLTGYQPGPAEQMELMRGIATLRPARQLNPSISPQTEQLIAWATRPAVNDRPTAQELLGVLDRLLEQVALPLPPAPQLPPFDETGIGRTQELATLTMLLGSRGAAALTGPAGVGKTTLAAMVALCSQGKEHIFWYGFRQGEDVEALIWALAAFLAHRGQRELWSLLQRGRLAGAQLPPLNALGDYLIQQLCDQKLLLCLDDVHLVEDDPQCTGLVRQLYATSQTGAVQLLLSGRRAPTFIAADMTLGLGGFTPDDARALLATRGIDLTDRQFTTLYAGTEGNPQFLLLAQIALQRAHDPLRQLERLATADDIERYILREVDAGLSAEERELLGAVAVLGDDGNRPALEALLERGGIQRTLHDLVDNHLLLAYESGASRSYRMHAIVQAFYYDQLHNPQRRRLHRRAGVFYEHEAADPIRAARHFIDASDPLRAARLLTSDVRSLLNSGRALALRRQLDRLTDAELDRMLWVDVQIALGEVHSLLREGAQARTSFVVALERLEQLSTAQRSRRYARICRGMGELLESEAPLKALDWLRGGLAALGDSGNDQELRFEEALLRLRIGATLMAQGAYDEALCEIDRSLQLLPGQNSHWHASAFMNRGSIFCVRGNSTQGLADYQRALTIYEYTHNDWGLIGIRQNQGLELVTAGAWETAASTYNEALDLARQHSFVSHQAATHLCLGVLRTNQGNFDEAQHQLAAGMSLAQKYALSEELIGTQSSLADLYIRQGFWEVAELLLRQAEQQALKLQITYQLPEITRGWAQVHAAHGHYEQAQQAAERAIALAQELGAEIDQGMGLRVLGQVLFARQQDDAAAAALSESQEILDQRDPYEAARTRLVWGQALLQRCPTSAAALQLLIQAHTTFVQLGASYDLALLEALAGPDLLAHKNPT